MAILGWVTLKEAERYTRSADQQRLAQTAMRMLETSDEAANEGGPRKRLYPMDKPPPSPAQALAITIFVMVLAAWFWFLWLPIAWRAVRTGHDEQVDQSRWKRI